MQPQGSSEWNVHRRSNGSGVLIVSDHVVGVLFSFILGENKYWQASKAAQVPRCPSVISEGFYVMSGSMYFM